MRLEKRILNVLNTKVNNSSKNKKKKLPIKGAVLVIASILTATAISGSCAFTKKTVSAEDFLQAWSGAWVNTDVPISNLAPRTRVNNPNGTIHLSLKASQRQNSHVHTLVLIDQWADSKGNIWYKAEQRCDLFHGTTSVFGRISNSGNTLEYIYHIGSVQIEKWEPDNPLYNYVIYHRL